VRRLDHLNLHQPVAIPRLRSSCFVHPRCRKPSSSTTTKPAQRERLLAPAPLKSVDSAMIPGVRGECTTEALLIPLIEAYNVRRKASAEFPTLLTSAVIRKAVALYENYIAEGRSTVEKVCGSCGSFVQGQIHTISIHDSRIELFRRHDPERICLDLCALNEDQTYTFCTACYKNIDMKRPPKFSGLNNVNVTLCQELPTILSTLTIAEECLIARCHPIGSILKLRPDGKANAAAYFRLRGHVIVLPQEPGPLLSLLPSPHLQLHEKIRVVWFGNQAPSREKLAPYLEVRRLVVLKALQWLQSHNPLYHSIEINHSLLSTWPVSFIPPKLQESLIVHTDNDSEEREGYASNLSQGNFENELQASLGEQDNNDIIATGCVFSDVESIRTNPDLKFISALILMKQSQGLGAKESDGVTAGIDDTGNSPELRGDVPVIRYISNGETKILSNWQHYDFFTGAFPTLFPFGNGGHLTRPGERAIEVSLAAWTAWCLTHHSRRFETLLTSTYRFK
jgi:hypothetical protein